MNSKQSSKHYSPNYLRILPLFSIVFAFYCMTAYSEEQPIVYVGVSTDAPDAEVAWTNSLCNAIARVRNSYPLGWSFALKKLPIGQCWGLGTTSCSGRANEVFLDGGVFSRIVLAQALMAAGSVVPWIKDKNKPMVESILPMDAVHLAEAMLSKGAPGVGEYSKSLIERGQLSSEQIMFCLYYCYKLWEYDNHDKPITEYDDTLAFIYTIYEASMNEILSFILGHELSHAFGRSPFVAQSQIEKSGIIDRFAKIQAANTIFSKNPLLVDEINADIYGYRALESMDEQMVKIKTANLPEPAAKLALNFLSISRRQAIDGIAYLFFEGVRSGFDKDASTIMKSKDGIPTVAFIQNIPEGYLFPGLRLIIFSETLRSRPTSNKQIVRISGLTAQLLVDNFGICMINGNYDSARGNRELANIFGSYVPLGVIYGWKTGVWDDSTSFQ